MITHLREYSTVLTAISANKLEEEFGKFGSISHSLIYLIFRQILEQPHTFKSLRLVRHSWNLIVLDLSYWLKFLITIQNNDESSAITILTLNSYPFPNLVLALWRACQKGHLKLVEEILKKDSAEFFEVEKAIMLAENNGHTKIVECLRKYEKEKNPSLDLDLDGTELDVHIL